MDAAELAFAGISRQAELLRSREVSPRELVELYLERIERLDPQLNSFRVVMGEEALAEAATAEERLGRGEDGALLGVPIAIKDNVDVTGELTSFGSAGFDGEASEDSEVVKRLRAAGAIVIGKTNLPELAICGFTESEAWGATRNPWNTDHTPGGSSGGSGAAVAAGLVGAAHASDGAGSIRFPAANCGLFGLKPQRDRVSLAPDQEHWHGLSVYGCVSRTVLDTALFLDVTSGPMPSDPSPPPAPERPFVESARTPPGKLRVAIAKKPTRLVAPPHSDEEALGTADEIGETLRSLGHEVFEQELDYGSAGDHFMPRYLRGILEEVRGVPHPERLEARTRGFARIGRLVPERLLRRARRLEASDRERIGAIYEKADVVLTPVMALPPIEVGHFEGKGALRTLIGMSRIYLYGAVWNHTGQPAAVIPAGRNRDGLPVAAMLVGRQNDESTLLSLSAQLEAERRWFEDRPPVS